MIEAVYFAIGLILSPVFVFWITNGLKDGLYMKDILVGIFLLGAFWPATVLFMIEGMMNTEIIPPRE